MRRRILLLVVGMTVLVVLAFAVPLAVFVRSSVAEHARERVAAEASRVTLAVGAYPTPSTSQLRRFVAQQTSSSGYPISITLPTGQVLGSTPADDVVSDRQHGNGSPSPSASPGGYGGGTAPGGYFGYRGPQSQPEPLPGPPDGPGGEVAIATRPTENGLYVVRVYLSDSALHDGEGVRWLLLAAVAALLIGVGVLAGEILTRRIVRPLTETADTAGRLTAGDITARAPTTGPNEVAEVGRALNRLADRIDELIAEERETVADLSHRLRTPLTALRLDAEALGDARIGEHVTTLERMLTAIIRAARRPQREGRLPSAEASSVVRDRVTFWSALAEDQVRAVTVTLDAGPLSVRAAAEDLGAAVDALLENVFAHTPEGTAFSVRLSRSQQGAELEVADDGPGLPADAEIRGRSDRGSSGLGLSIARRCAESSGGGMRLSRSPSGGAVVTLVLGRS